MVSIAEESIIEMMDAAPESVITVAAFRNETIDVWIPFEIPDKGVEDHDKTGSEIHGFVLFEKHAGDNAVNGMEKAVQERTVMQEEIPEIFVNGKNAMPVGNVDKFKGHGGSAFHGMFIAAGEAETAVATERDKF